jgi:hypothetical protein
MDRRPFGTAKAVPFHNLEISIVVAPDGRVGIGLSYAAPTELVPLAQAG